MTYTTLEALRLAEEAFMKIADLRNLGKINPEVIAFETLYIVRAARAQDQAEQERMNEAAKRMKRLFERDGCYSYAQMIRTEAEQVEQEHDGHWSDCSVHNEPAYPNGECDCGGYPSKQAEQEPVGYTAQSVIDWLSSDERTDSAYSSINLYKNPCGSSDVPLYAAPVRTKDLTDEEIAEAVGSPLDEVYLADFRAVIAADRSKNK